MDVNELMLTVLDDEARESAPRLFALYGVYRERLGEDDDGAFLAFGMEFAEPRKAIMWEPGMTWHSDSAASILKRYRKTAEARLVWLNEPECRAMNDYELAGG
ncbi:hypothetical protein ACFWY9_41265 [Amycolatopsis sp. NPDC059027]|uniref:hypothetical protein n=1 Tax=unclassified Amycolatopsis TaxID=2618356 RepID=UPI003672D490